MHYRWLDILNLLKIPVGRFQLLHGVYQNMWPLLSRIASLYRRTLVRKTRVVAVVGSFGKSTTMRALFVSLIGQVQPWPPRSSWSFLARAILRIRPDDRHAVIEVGIDGTGQMAAYARMIKPNITVVTLIRPGEHHRSLKTLEITRAEKSEMVRILPKTGIAVLNGDDPNVLWMESQTRARVVRFGFNDTNDIRASDIRLDWPNGTRFKLHAEGKIHNMHVRLIGRHMIYPILAGVAVGLAEGFSIDRILTALEELAPTPGRMQPVKLANGAIIICDDFKSALETFEAALDVFSEIPAKRRIVVFGDVTEPQGSYGPTLRHLGERIGKISSKAIFVCHKRQFRAYAAGAVRSGLSRSALVNAGRSVLNAAKVLQDDIGPMDVVLIKGRNNQRLERVAFSLTGKKVYCDIRICNAKVNCGHCPMLEQRFNGLRVVV